VNEHLGAKVYPCEIEGLNKFWGYPINERPETEQKEDL
jgi:hypothetical protein